jgi:putative copper export protein
MAEPGYVAALIVHAVLAAAWFGGTAFAVLAMQPLLRNATHPTRREFSGRFWIALIRFHNIAGGFTLLSGLVLFALHDDAWTTETRWAKIVWFGLIATLGMLYLVNTGLRSTNRAIEKVSQSIDPASEPPATLRLLQVRMGFTSRLILALQAVVLALMVYASRL